MRILVAPLDWGLGHATRCIPLIRLLKNKGVEVIVAGEGPSLKILVEAFPGIASIPLGGYHIQYNNSRSGFVWKMASQVPHILQVIRKEERWLAKTLLKYKIDAVISDNRYGLHHPSVPCVFITHQLQVMGGNRLMDKLMRSINYKFINNFQQCWVPDVAGEKSLAGKLSHPRFLPGIPVHFTGPLSRFQKKETSIRNKLAIVLSGPEPQRTILENIIVPQLQLIPGSVVLVRGLPDSTEMLSNIPENTVAYNHLPALALNEVMQQSELVLCRAGYSTIMDLVTIGKPAVLVPTPGQTEQEYLATYLSSNRMFYTMKQEQLSLENIFEMVNRENFKPNMAVTFNETPVVQWLETIAGRKKSST